jgi:hypothetical protein
MYKNIANQAEKASFPEFLNHPENLTRRKIWVYFIDLRPTFRGLAFHERINDLFYWVYVVGNYRKWPTDRRES